MEKLTKLIIYLLLAGVVFSPFFANIYLFYHKNNFSCEADFYIKKADFSYMAKIIFYFRYGKGMFHMAGSYNGLDNNLRKVEWSAPFTYTRDVADRMLLLSTEGIKDNELAVLLNPVVPDFYLFKDHELKFVIFPQGNEGYVFISDGIPMFLCVKI